MLRIRFPIAYAFVYTFLMYVVCESVLRHGIVYVYTGKEGLSEFGNISKIKKRFSFNEEETGNKYTP